MSIFYNIRAQFVEDEPYLIELTRRHKPRWALVLDGTGLARKLKEASPNTNVIVRYYPDDRIEYLGSPRDFFDRVRKEVDGSDLWVYVGNEVGVGGKANKFWNDLIEINIAEGRPLKFVIGNMSVGTPEPDAWRSEENLALLRLLDKERATVVLGLHEYAHGVMASGLQDNNDTNILMNNSLWPTLIDVRKNNWHCGRFKWIVDTCRDNHINPPRIVITEHGFDDLSDMHWWFKPEGGWQYLTTFWYRTFATKAEEFYAWQLDYADRVIYPYAGVVEGQLIFQYGKKPSGRWDSYNVEGFKTLHDILAKREGDNVVIPTEPETPTEPEQPPPATPEDNTVMPVVIEALDKNTPVRFRSTPNVTSNANVIGVIKGATNVWVFVNVAPVTVTSEDGKVWTFRKYQIGTLVGWAAVELLKVSTPPEDHMTIEINVFRDLKARVAHVQAGIEDLTRQTAEVLAIIDNVENDNA